MVEHEMGDMIEDAYWQDGEIKQLKAEIEKLRSNKKPVCVNCMIAMHVNVIGATLVEMWRSPPEPYRLTAVDIAICPACRASITWGHGGVTNWHDDDFAKEWERVQGRILVYCYERVSDAREAKELENGAEVNDG